MSDLFHRVGLGRAGAPAHASALAVMAAVLVGTAVPVQAAEKLARRLERALARVAGEAQAGTKSASPSPPAAADSVPADPVEHVGKLLPELEREVALQRQAFRAMTGKGLASEAAASVAEAAQAYEESHGRLLSLVQEIVRASAPATSATPPPDVKTLARQAREILGKIDEWSRKRPISAGEIKVGAPAALASPVDVSAAASTPAADEALPPLLQQAAAGLSGPVEVYEWVRNSVGAEFYYGRMKGAVQTYLERTGNDADTAALLIQLLRAKQVPARYARGTVELPAATLASLAGTRTAEEAVRVLERATVPHEVILAAGGVAGVRMERVWVEAYVPYDNYRGTSLDAGGKTWIPLDAAFKGLEPPAGIDVVGELGLDARALLDEYLEAPRAETPLEFVRSRVNALLAAERPGTPYEEVLNRRRQVPQMLGILPGVLPYKVIGPVQTGAQFPSALVHHLRVVGELGQETLLDATFPVEDLLGRRLTLAYIPATADDERYVREAGGLLLVPPYLVDVRPILKSRGVAIAAGSPVRLGRRFTLRLELGTPAGTVTITNEVIAGNLTAIGLGGREVTGSEVADEKAASILSGVAWSYLERWNASDEELANLFRVVPVRPTVSVCFVMSDLDVRYANPAYPLSLTWKGLSIDADLRSSAPAGIESRDNERPFLLVSGLEGSILENRVFEDGLGLLSISTAKALQQARAEAIDVRDYTTDTSEVPDLDLDPSVKDEVLEATARGLLARVPVRELTYFDWTGVGYLLLDEATGEAAYQLQGGHSGGSTAVPPIEVPGDLMDAIITQDEEAAAEGTEVARIEKFPSTDFQEGTVNRPLASPLRVLVTDTEGRPVPNAPVTFTVADGGGALVDTVLGGTSSQVSVLSDTIGQAEVRVVLGRLTGDNPRYVQLEEDEKPTQVGLNLVTARSGAAALAEPFRAMGFPDDLFDGERHATLRFLIGGAPWFDSSNLSVPGRFMWVAVEDPHGNPLSNIPVRFAYWPDPIPDTPPPGWVVVRPANKNPGAVLTESAFRACASENPLVFFGECEGAAPEVSVKSDPSGATAYPVVGDSPYSFYVFAIGTQQAPFQLPVYYGTWGPVCQGADASACAGSERPLHFVNARWRRRLVSGQGEIIEGYPTLGLGDVTTTADGLFEKERITREVDADGKAHFRATGINEWYKARLTDSVIHLAATSPGTDIEPPVMALTRPGEYRSAMTMADLPQKNTVTVQESIHLPWVVPYLKDGSFDVDPAYVADDGAGNYTLTERIKDPGQAVRLAGGAFSLWGVRPEIKSLSPTPVLLDANQLVARPSLISPEVQPAELQALVDPRQVLFELKAEDQTQIQRTGTTPYELYSGLPLPPVPHTAHVTVFGLSLGTDTLPIASVPFSIPTCEMLLLSTPSVVMARTHDPLNGVTCGEPARIVFDTCRAAQVTIALDGSVLIGGLDGADPAAIENVSLPPGRHIVTLASNLLGDFDRKATFKISAVDLDDGVTRAEALGTIESTLRNRSVLPVGRTFVKGVDIFDGHLVQQSQDIKVPGRHLGLEVTRSYSSAGRSPEGIIGAGWAFNYGSTLNQSECGLVNVSTPDGSSQVFRSTDGGFTFTPQKGYHTTLVKNADQSYDFFDKAGTRYHFREPEDPGHPVGDRRLEYVEEPHGDRIVLTYDGQGRMSRVAEVQVGSGSVRTLEVTYGKAGGFDRIVRMAITALEIAADYKYDERGNLIEVVRSGRNLSGPAAEDRKEAYEYSVDDPRDRHQLKAVVDPNGNRTEYVYYAETDEFLGDDSGLVVSTKEEYVKEVVEFPRPGSRQGTEFQYDYRRAVQDQVFQTTVRDARASDTLYVLNGNGSPLEIREPLDRTTVMEWATTDIFKTRETDAEDRVTEYGYDGRGNLTSERIATDLGLVETTYEYDLRFNKLTLKRDAEGRETSYEIDAGTGDLLAMTDAVGNVTRYDYDPRGQLISVTDPRGHATVHEDHDSFGNARTIRDPEGNVTTREYDLRGRLIRQTDTMGREGTTVYDGLDRPVKVTEVAGGDSFDSVTQTEYVPGGQVQSFTNANGATTTNTLDGLSRMVATSTPVGGEILTTAIEYDGNGNKEQETDRRGVIRRFTYDALNRLRRIDLVGGLTGEGPTGEVATFGYDKVGNTLFETDVARQRTDYEYDGLYRMVKKLLPESGPSGRYVEEFEYDKVGNRTAQKDANGNPTRFEYDGVNRVVRTTNALGHVVTVTYDDPEPGDSKVNKSEESDLTRGLRTTFSYDTLNRETERKVFLEGAGSAGEVYTMSTVYTDATRTITVTDPRGTPTRTRLNGRDQVVEVTVDPSGLNLRTLTSYDGLGKTRRVVDPNTNVTRFENDELGRLVTMTDALQRETSYRYDGEGLKVSETDRRGVRREFTYDRLGRPRTSRVVPSISGKAWSRETRYQDLDRKRVEIDARGKPTTSSLDRTGRVVELADPFGRTVKTTWDGVNRRAETDKRNRTTSFDHDALNRLVRTVDPAPFASQTFETTFDDAANRRLDKDRRNIQTVVQMDPLGRVLTVTRAGIRLEANTYDGNGNKVAALDGENKETRFAYDAANWLGSRTDGFGTATAATTEFRYDDNGNKTVEIDPRATEAEPSMRYGYDELNRLRSQTDGESHTTAYDYDEEGNRIFVKEPEGQETTFAYDELGKLLRVTQPSPAAGQPQPVTTHAYDESRNRIRQTDANTHVVEMAYDDLNRLVSMTQDPGGLNLVTVHEYDENGNEILLTDPKGQKVTSTYDELNRLQTKTYAGLPAELANQWRHTVSIAYTYDANNNLRQVEESVASGTDPPDTTLVTTRVYDDLDRLISETQPLPDGGTRTVGYTYFNNGTRKTITDPAAAVTSYTYDGQNRLATATTAAGTTTYSYFPDDLLQTVTYPNGVVATHGYDKADRLFSLANAKGGTAVSSYDYTYDGNGNRLSQIEANGATETTTYTYDGLNRLETVTYPDEKVAYGYDAVGNRARETERDLSDTVLSDKTASFDAVNRIESITDSVAPANDTTFTWDANGNQTTRTVGGVTTEYRYDTRDKLVEVAQGASVLGRFQYCCDGKRIKKIGEEGIRQYVYDQTSTFLEYDEAGTQKAKYDYGSDRLISLFRADEGRRFFSFDGLRSVTNLTDDSGLSVAAYHLDAWGNFRFPSELTASRNRFAFTGYEWDQESGLFNAKARYFDPEVGRFTSQDSFLGAIDDPPSLHRYFYANANPTTYVDPTGFTAEGAQLQSTLRETKQYFLDQAKGEGLFGKLKGLAFGLLAGATGLVESTVAIVDEAATVTYAVPGIDLTGDPTGVQSQEEIKQQVADLRETYHTIKEEGVGNALGRVAKNAGDRLLAAAKGDPRAIAEVTALLTEVAGPAALLKGAGAVRAAREGASEVLEGAGDVVRATRRHIGDLVAPRGYRIGEVLPDGRIAGEGPGAALRGGRDFARTLDSDQARAVRGAAIGGENLPEVSGRWLRGTHGNVGMVPRQVAEALSGRTFKDLREFREEFWKAVAAEADLAAQFGPRNVALMKAGYAPIAHRSQWLGKQKSYILHHRTPIQQGGGVFDLENIAVVTPRFHKEILEPALHYR